MRFTSVYGTSYREKKEAFGNGWIVNFLFPQFYGCVAGISMNSSGSVKG